MRRLLNLALLLAISIPTFGKPDPGQLMDAPVLREASDYRFSTLELDSIDGGQHYRIWLGRPLKVTNTNPVAYLLDGNAAMMALDAQLLNRLSRSRNPPVLVAVGYATPLRIERRARTLDYTPKVGSGEQRDPLNGMPSGGADVFLDLLTEKVEPLINQLLDVRPQRQLLWGHSYGGLFVLHTLMTRPNAFQVYAAASPSLWWKSGVIQTESVGLQQRLQGSRPRLLVMRGDTEAASPGPVPKTADRGDGAAKQLLATLQKVPGLKVYHQSFAALGHGPMLQASLRYTLENFSQSWDPPLPSYLPDK